MKRYLLIFILTPLLAMGQIFKSPNQQFVEQAIKDGMFIIKQSYQLEDTVTKQRFGRYGNEDFGSFASLAIRTNEGILVDKVLSSPWTEDPNFSRYRDTHRPLLSKTIAVEFGDSIPSQVSISYDSIHSINSRLSLVCEIDSTLTGFELKKYNRPTEGWIVWLSNDSTMNEYSGRKNPDFTIYKKNVEFNTDSISYVVEVPSTPKKVWGGIFIVPEQTNIGQITFFLGGIVNQNPSDDTWVITPVEIIQSLSEVSRPSDELTPLTAPTQKKKKNKKKK